MRLVERYQMWKDILVYIRKLNYNSKHWFNLLLS